MTPRFNEDVRGGRAAGASCLPHPWGSRLFPPTRLRYRLGLKGFL